MLWQTSVSLLWLSIFTNDSYSNRLWNSYLFRRLFVVPPVGPRAYGVRGCHRGIGCTSPLRLAHAANDYPAVRARTRARLPRASLTWTVPSTSEWYSLNTTTRIIFIDNIWKFYIWRYFTQLYFIGYNCFH